MNTEQLRHAMYADLKCMRTQKKHPRLLGCFEENLERYLEALRQEHERGVQLHAAIISDNCVLRDAYENQKILTRAACVSERETWNDFHELREQVQGLEVANKSGFDELHKTLLECDRLAESNKALVSVVETQQIALTKAQTRTAAHKELGAHYKSESLIYMQDCVSAERVADSRYELIEAKDKLIKDQRRAISKLSMQLKAASQPLLKRLWARVFGAK